jgi:hypothetical protein
MSLKVRANFPRRSIHLRGDQAQGFGKGKTGAQRPYHHINSIRELLFETSDAFLPHAADPRERQCGPRAPCKQSESPMVKQNVRNSRAGDRCTHREQHRTISSLLQTGLLLPLAQSFHRRQRFYLTFPGAQLRQIAIA